MQDVVHRYLETLGVSPSFLMELRDSADDWSFIIKISALLEAAIGNAIRAHFSDERFHSFLAGLSMSAKLKIADDLELTLPAVIKFMRAVSEMRNELVHQVSSTSFNFVDEQKGKLKDKVENLRETCAQNWLPDSSQTANEVRLMREVFTLFPRAIVTEFLYFAVACVHLSQEKSAMRDDIYRRMNLFFEKPVPPETGRP